MFVFLTSSLTFLCQQVFLDLARRKPTISSWVQKYLCKRERDQTHKK